MFERTLPLFLLIGSGTIAAGLGVFPHRETAIGALNRFTLYLAMPALIIASLSQSAFVFPEGGTFYGLHGLYFACIITLTALVARRSQRLRSETGPAISATLHGNTAFLGIPLAAALIGDQSAGVAALSAAVYGTFAMSIMPSAFAGLGNTSWTTQVREALRRSLEMPLVWAPFIGIGLRFLPGGASELALPLLERLGAAATPCALVTMGIYLWDRRTEITQIDQGALLLALLKMVAAPLLALGILWLFGAPLRAYEAQVFLLQSAMPTGVMVFGMANLYGRAERLVSATIIATMLGFFLTLPLLLAPLLALFGELS